MRYVIGNWKMHTTVSEAVALAGHLDDALRQQLMDDSRLPEVVVCPPFTALSPVQDVLDSRTLQLGAQNCHWEERGPFTGEISAPMLAPLVSYCLVGHHERRQFGETDGVVARKVESLIATDIVPVVFVGEADPSADIAKVVAARLQAVLAEVGPAETPSLIVAYEPTWAPGQEDTAPYSHIADGVGHIRSTLAEMGFADTPVVYGGSVDEDNIDTLQRIPDLAGVVVGRASLDVKAFTNIVSAVAAW